MCAREPSIKICKNFLDFLPVLNNIDILHFHIMRLSFFGEFVLPAVIISILSILALHEPLVEKKSPPESSPAETQRGLEV